MRGLFVQVHGLNHVPGLQGGELGGQAASPWV